MYWHLLQANCIIGNATRSRQFIVECQSQQGFNEMERLGFSALKPALDAELPPASIVSSISVVKRYINEPPDSYQGTILYCD